MSQTTLTTSFDLTRRAPRSPRHRLGGFAILPRMLDKCRALLAGKIGEYHFDCPLDRQFLSFVQIDAEALKTELAAGRTDSEMLAWILTHAGRRPEAWEIEAWSAYQDRRLPSSDPETRAFFTKILTAVGGARADVHSWTDLIDLDDHVSFGGTA